jgi:hypothetical protein
LAQIPAGERLLDVHLDRLGGEAADHLAAMEAFGRTVHDTVRKDHAAASGLRDEIANLVTTVWRLDERRRPHRSNRPLGTSRPVWNSRPPAGHQRGRADPVGSDPVDVVRRSVEVSAANLSELRDLEGVLQTSAQQAHDARLLVGRIGAVQRRLRWWAGTRLAVGLLIGPVVGFLLGGWIGVALAGGFWLVGAFLALRMDHSNRRAAQAARAIMPVAAQTLLDQAAHFRDLVGHYESLHLQWPCYGPQASRLPDHLDADRKAALFVKRYGPTDPTNRLDDREILAPDLRVPIHDLVSAHLGRRPADWNETVVAAFGRHEEVTADTVRLAGEVHIAGRTKPPRTERWWAYRHPGTGPTPLVPRRRKTADT